MEKKLAINGGDKTITINKPHYVWPEITKETEEEVLKQLNKSICICLANFLVNSWFFL